MTALTPTTGSLVENAAPYWADKGYKFTALSNFIITGADWYLNLPAAGAVHLSIWDSAGNLLARSVDVSGDGTERWYRTFLAYTFVAGQTYTVSFHDSVAQTSTFDRMDNPTYPYVVTGYVSGVQHVSSNTSGDGAAEQYPNSVNSWAPLQRLLIVQ